MSPVSRELSPAARQGQQPGICYWGLWHPALTPNSPPGQQTLCTPTSPAEGTIPAQPMGGDRAVRGLHLPVGGRGRAGSVAGWGSGASEKRTLAKSCQERWGCGQRAGEHWASRLGSDVDAGRQSPNSLPGTWGRGPVLTCAATRTFWFKLLPWRGSGGPENTARHKIGRAGGRSSPRHEAEWGRTLAPASAGPLEQPPLPGLVLQHHTGPLPILLPQLPHSSPRYLLPPG